ncbi:Uncharacterized protein dnm_008110 [Desulfonema magnum]|uniref:Uncharacterized protein n=1 Tax=Desulfonema magnum TaxID=45655 RepID=A0A975BG55_9BACT|nr:Uncharacterized protein dnm_008110 [Desulfonema magnum]
MYQLSVIKNILHLNFLPFSQFLQKILSEARVTFLSQSLIKRKTL